MRPFTFHKKKFPDLLVREACGNAGDLTTLWSCAPTMSDILASTSCFPEHFWKGKRVLELGSGVGLLGIAAACLGADVVLTDLPDPSVGRLALLEENIKLNECAIASSGGSATVEGLDWCNRKDWAAVSARNFDVILCADLVYGNQIVWNDLIALLCELDRSDPEPLILFGFEHRPDRFPWSSPILGGLDPDLCEVSFFARLCQAFYVERFCEPLAELKDDGRWPEKIEVFRLRWRWKALQRAEVKRR
eukprot:g3058.t1